MQRIPRRSALRALGLAMFCLMLLAGPAWATRTQRFTDDTFADFKGGETTTSTLSDQGYLTLPPAKEKLYAPDKTEAFWDAVTGPEDRIFLGSGHSGKIFSLDRDSSGSLFAKLQEPEVYALGLTSEGMLLAAGSPGGVIRQVKGADEITTFAKTGQKYVWALERYPGGDLFAATGPEGKILQIDSEGSVEDYATVKNAKNILDLAFDPQGRLLAVTESKGFLVRIDGKDKEPFVLYEADMEEIRRVVVDRDEDIWIAVNGEKSTGRHGEGGPGGPGGAPSPADIARMMSGGDDSGPNGGPGGPSGPPSRGGPSGRKAPSKIVLLSPEGFVRMAWTPPDSPIYDIYPDPAANRLYVATGNGGDLYRVDRLGHYEKLTAVREKGILRLVPRADGSLLALTNSPAVAYGINPQASTDGEFASRVLDAENPVRWGRILVDADIPAGATVLLDTRTGNTSDPESHWSEWSDTREVIPGTALEVKSPPARRLQYRLQMKAASAEDSGKPRVEQVQIPFSAPNQPPDIKDIEVTAELQAPGDGGRPGGGPPSPRNGGPSGPPIGPKVPSGPGGNGRPGASGGPSPVDVPADSNVKKMTLSWKAEDPNQDDLSFKIYIRPETDEEWVLLQEDQTEPKYSLDSMALPDGRYTVRIEATDLPSNLPGQELTAEAISDPFEVDNTPPHILNPASKPGAKGAVGVSFRAEDETTLIASAQWRINGRDWRYLAPADAIFDAKSETFEFAIPVEDFEGEKSAMVTVRATDERGNTGVALIRVQVRP